MTTEETGRGRRQRFFGWGCEIGHRYVPCKRCSATGRITSASSVGTKAEGRSEQKQSPGEAEGEGA